MAGNTKLRGFGKDNTICLERWGGKVSLELPHEAIRELRKACFDLLPKQPPRLGELDPEEFDATYLEATGRVIVSMSPNVCKQIAELIEAGSTYVKEENARLARDSARELEDCWQAHHNYLNADEPGVTE